MKNGSLPRLDREGVPKFPLFLYDEDVVEPGKLTNGLFRGPLLIAVSSFPFCKSSPVTPDGFHRFTNSSSSQSALQEGKKRQLGRVSLR